MSEETKIRWTIFFFGMICGTMVGALAEGIHVLIYHHVT